ncbi:Rieske (2Fe-2S) protein [Mycolicibacterium sp. P1-18]|uniref:QcrA and Rieske domain-containing protein n=1 Tax=Mycolicibacterium sp. P1-18 TaxID=2024615 RepID=UPI0011F15242|nr:Rieske (2Fe-2S) protein [Mycolicibacterium sp. P1-18]KAA0100064.1 Rieske (2Fe-2S) protein [Mycolicibacterium sp. P1-18]
MHDDEFVISRKTAIISGGTVLTAAVLSACTTYGKAPTPPPDGGSPADATVREPSGTALATTSDVPVGSGLIVDGVVLTQPSAGVFNGFSAVCTHAGCSVSKIADGTIDCPCHGSKFNLDGTVANGPASKPLEPKSIVIEDDSILLA